MTSALGRREMRHHDRRPAAVPVLVRAARNPGAGIHLDSANLSEGGAFLRSDLLFEVGEVLTVEIPLPAGGVVKTAARVVRVARDKDPAALHGMGIEFTGLSPQDRRLLQEGSSWQRPSTS